MLSKTGHGCRRPTTAIVSAAVCLLTAALAMSRAEAAQEIRFKVIDGKPCAKSTLRCGTRAIPANVVIDLGVRAPLVLHERTAKLLQLGPDGAMEVSFEGAVFTDLRARAAGLKSLEELTDRHSSELEEIPAVAIIGMPAFAKFSLQLEVAEGVLRLLPPAERRAAASTQPTGDDKSCTLPYEERGWGCFLPGLAPDDFALRVLFATSGYDTFIDSNTADLAGSPGGALDDLRIGTLNIAKYVAFRPEDLSGTPEPHPDVVLGLNLLSHFRVTIDPVNRRMTFEQTRAPQFPTEEREYFLAATKGDADAIESFLKSHGDSRLAAAAGEKLWALRLEEDPPNRDALVRALRCRAEAAPKDRRAGDLVTLADSVVAGNRADKYVLATDVLKLAMENAPVALNGRTAHDIRARLGMIALRRNDLKQARRDLLSAAFGIPRDPLVNLWLGEFYEQSGQPSRAWSRYVQTAINEKAPPEAITASLTGLDRLNRDPAFRATFTMADAEQLLEGRIVEFHPAGRYGETASRPASGPVAATNPAMRARPVRLVELFTCVDHPVTQGPELAFDGLREYFAEPDTDEVPASRPAASTSPAARADVAFIEYHVAAPETDPLVCNASAARAAFLGVSGAPAVYFDGDRPSTDGGGEKDVEKIFTAYRAAALESQDGDGTWQLTGAVKASDGQIAGAIELLGPVAPPALRVQILLCEKMVMAPGANKLLLHRMVARSSLSPEGGFAVSPAAGRRTFTVHAATAEIGKALEQTIGAMEKERQVKFVMRPAYVDASACTVVAFLYNRESKQVMAACSIDIAADGKDKP